MVYGNQAQSNYDLVLNHIFHFVVVGRSSSRQEFTLNLVDFNGVPADMEHAHLMLRLKDVEKVFCLKSALNVQKIRTRAAKTIVANIKRGYILKLAGAMMKLKKVFFLEFCFVFVFFIVVFVGWCSGSSCFPSTLQAHQG